MEALYASFFFSFTASNVVVVFTTSPSAALLLHVPALDGDEPVS